METFKITFFREGDEEAGETFTEFIAANDVAALQEFKSVEPFATIIKIEQIE